MKRRRKKWTHVTLLAMGMAALMAFSGIGNVTAKGLSEAQKEKEQLEQELKEAQEMIDNLNDSKEDMESAVKELDTKLQNISKQISDLENQLTEKQASVDETQAELAAAEEDRQKQYEDMKLRIQFMYENQSTSALEKLLTAGSIAEFLNSAEYIAQISQYDRNMLVKYEETVENIAKMEETLKTEISELEAMKEKVEQEQKAVAALVQEKEEKLAETEGQIVDAQKVAEAYEAEIDAQNEIIAQIQQAEEERRKKEEEQNRDNGNNTNNDNNVGNNTGDNTGDTGGNNNNDNGGGNSDQPSVSAFTWPCPSSRRVTSDYGPRQSPTAGASSYHKGIDIGASYGADIVAAADGTVVFAGYSNSAGNYVTVSHGGGLYTVYMHCSSLNVSKGQSVSRGQVIAKVGSTGISTGNHLHFGVSLNGSYVNPWNYL
ncbi:murein hydrolase activator EnvC family protein [Roseburia sp. MSJ-14]|uniref:murein hydrolase activator EnvC family protein n=1 Tax=Roseburia sp. MSJ-14 TaxID=2841514 RepID=UPI001C102D8D|nr:M23 family metallopeptidase [Roseburia sp. MSJ-14]MBU5474966.1 peptidoglycan DD-metalloendopeptidase family protein [Roseburia sp. MSJ-14]